ncbi:MFS transporter [Mangrovihabitans endophyticus]|uniref:MFS transporter n=1 Tax=Mangrovihabitans endophyticus TaxID=1751298 RepID=A0A8J3FMV1_9ACTN|nr:MFS transporter [Mangrovihabitans endophyticus]GGK87155.1 MFS transporter [Mangrovihabitans endophyticus]
MTLTPYKETLALRGIRSLLVVATLARIPIAAGPVVITLHVVQDLHRGYGLAGLATAAFTIGSSLGAPIMGRLMDGRGLRPVLVLTTVGEVTFWTSAQAMPYWAVLLAALVGGIVTLPAFAVARQSIAALAPESHRRAAFSLDSIATEISFMTGPALGVVVATTVGGRPAMFALGAGILISGIGLFWLDPPIRGRGEEPTSVAARVPRRSWVTPRFVAVLAVTMASTVVLSGTDVAIIGNLRGTGQVEWTGLVYAVWAAYSMLGGFAYGTGNRSLSPLTLLASMAVVTVPVGLGGHQWWLLAVLMIPAGALCAPTITATADVVSRLAPAAARGEAMGLHNSSLTVGVALGAPVAGAAMDALSPPWGFAAVGGLGMLVALAVLPTELRRRADERRAAAAQRMIRLDTAVPAAGAVLAAEAEPSAGAEPAR